MNAPALPDNSQSDIATFIRWPANVAAGLFAGLVLLLFFWQKHRARRINLPGPATSTPPGDLTPAQAGALARGRVSGVLMQATLLYMACRGTLAIEVLGQDELVIHLRKPKATWQGIEHQMWKLLSSVEAQYYAVTPPALKRNRQAWVQMQLALRQEMMNSGWFDPHSFRWKGFRFLGGCLGLGLAFVNYGYAVVGQEIWGLLGISLFLGTAVLLFIWAYTRAETTSRGECFAAQWRAYRAGLDEACEQFGGAAEMEQALPYALALGAKRFLARYAHLAAAADYRPGWLRYSHHATMEQGVLDGWQVFLHTLRLPSLGLMPIVAPENRHAL